MVKPVSIFLLLALLPVCFGLGSCAKKQSPDTPFTRLIGKWKKVQYATDDNNSGAIDSWEISPVQPAITNTIEFKKDSTGVEKTTFSPDLNFRWMVTGESSVVISYNANDTVTYSIATVNSAHLNLSTHTAISLVEYYYDTDN